MARRRRRKRKKSALDYIALPSLNLDPDTKRGIFIVFVLAFGVVSVLSLLDMAGVMGVYLQQGLALAFGWGKWIFPLIMLMWGYFLYDEERFEIRGGNYLGLFIFIFSFHALLFLMINQELWPEALANGQGGGYVGLFLATSFIKIMGFIASLLVIVCLLLVSFMLIFNTTLTKMIGRESLLAKLFFPMTFVLAKLFNKEKKEVDDGDGGEDDDDDDDDKEDDKEDDEEDDDDDDDDDDNEEDKSDDDEEGNDGKDRDGEKFASKEIHEFAATPKKGEIQHSVEWWQPNGIEINLPLKLLDGKKGKPTSGDIKANKEIIENALKNFGIPVEMGEVKVGPTVTQYTFRPAEGVKLSKIVNLSNDMALALAAHPIRIEAPIPGKSLVGIEVPNQAKAVVGLKEALASKQFREKKNNLTIALGKDVSGRPWFDDISRMPHLLVAGATNSGKSVCLNSIIVSLLYQNNPDDLRFILVDPKRVELPVYNNIPYLLTPVITDVHKTVNALKWCLNEMDRRFEILSTTGRRNIQAYNENARVRMPYIVFIVDELADLMVAAGRDIEAGVIRLAQMARAVGIHLILATQRPSVDVITGLIKANMPSRIAFSVASGVDSRTILDSLGADKLLGRGDMLYINSEMSKPKRLQGAFVSDLEIRKITRFIKDKGGSADYNKNITDKQKVRGIAGVGFDGNEDEDELLAEAKELIINTGKASASFLQRRLSIGYARAARILDILEQAGVVGPSNGAKPREILISKEQYGAMISQGVSGVPLHDREEAEAPEEYLEDEEEPSFAKATEGKDEEDEEGENEDDDGGDDEDDQWGEEEDDDDKEKKDDEEEKENDEDEEEDKKKPKKKDKKNKEEDDSWMYWSK